MKELGRALVVLGVVIAAVGAILWSGVGRNWFGRLPGDIAVKRENFSFYFPLTTCIVISIVLTILLRIFRR